jgi:beta-glucanase (GH16 family)
MRAYVLTFTLAALGLAALAYQSPGLAQAPTPANTGNAPGGAFILRGEDGFDGRHYRISDWEIPGDWIDAGFSPSNVLFRNGRLHLSLTNEPYMSKSHSGAEFMRKGFYGYGRYEAVMRGIAGPGVVTSFFTHTHGQFGDPHEEIDIELLGHNTRQIHLNNYRDGQSDGSVDIDLPFDFSQGEHLYAFEWRHDSVIWFVDGVQIHEARTNIPTASSRPIVNVWTAGKDGYDWIGKPALKSGAAAVYRCISHVPVGQIGPQCSDSFAPPAR